MNRFLKNTVFLLVILNTSSLFAGDFPCMHLQLRIKNNSSSTCYLTKMNLKGGTIRSATQELFEITPNQETIPIEIGEITFSYPDLMLTYQCGEGRLVTIESIQYMCLTSGVIEGRIRNIENMGAEYSSSRGSYWGNRSGKITWTLS